MNGATAKGPTNNRPNIFWPSTFRESAVPKCGVLKLFVSISSRRNMMGKSHLNLGRKIWPVTVLLIFIAVNIIIFNEFVVLRHYIGKVRRAVDPLIVPENIILLNFSEFSQNYWIF